MALLLIPFAGFPNIYCPYVDTVGRNEKAIKEYVRNQLQEDIASDQISIKEFTDPFTGEPVNKGKK